MFIYELMPDINLEDYNNEFKGIIKEGIKYKDDKEKRYEYGWLKELVAFSNTEGGNLYIGVENLTHKIMALSHQEVDKITLMIHRLVKQDITPEISYRIEAIEVQSKENEPRYILLVKVKKNKFTPVFLKQNGINVCYIRHFGKTSIASTNEMVRLCYQNTSFSYDSIFTNTKFDLNNFTKLNSYYNKIKNKDLNVKELISIGFIDEDQNLSNGALMFKDDFKDESLALINCTKYEGINKGGDYFFNNRCFASNLLDEYEKILDFILTNSNQGFKKVVNGRIDVTSYPNKIPEDFTSSFESKSEYIV